MELRQLEYFVAVAEEAGFTRAAARLHVAQPGVSAQVRQLERELGQPLFDRSARTVRLTEAGEAVLPYARAALAAVAGARHAVDELTGLTRGHVTLGMIATRASLGVPELLAGFHRAHPEVEITLTESDSAALLEALRAGRMDAAVVGLATGPPPGIAAQVLTEQPLMAAVSPGHPFAARRSLRLAALADEPLISLPHGTGLRTAFDAACATAGIRPRIAFEAGDPHVLVQLAAQGLGVAILPSSLAEARRSVLHPLPLTHPAPRARLALARRAEGPSSPAARAFLTHARETFGRQADPPGVRG
ncbi:LysR family transcriptional regulator [Streptomyces sp. GC420]|uniref:LysR family transcriptional regulator n=1 Tax=Streptomyces sp. GC420 TaxID=2697568 RepID=UPI0014150968|nr:LysR substrate-binding domain-containing protein [Streptomyces sp. GC420]NBM15433.1 LysR family transcriptional regulator [Streptomyces sp. GC420]